MQADQDQKISSSRSGNKGGGKRPKWLPFAVLAVIALFGVFLYMSYQKSEVGGMGGDLPLVSADGSPAKVRPDNREGMEFPHQDKLVFDRVGGKSGTLQAENVVSGSEEPVPLGQMDSVSEDYKEIVVGQMPEDEGSADGEEESGETYISMLPDEPESPPVVVEAKKEAVKAEQKEVVSTITFDDETASVVIKEEPKVVAEAKPEPKPEPAPDPTPEPKVEVKEEPASTPVKPEPKPEPKPAAVASASGPYWIQVASVTSESAAQTQGKKLKDKYSDLIGGMDIRVETAEIPGKGTFHRLQFGGVSSKDSADGICQGLKGRGQDCLVVKR